MEYNTSRNSISIREYGRHIQRMIEFIMTIEDRERRNRQAKLVIELMGFLNPHLRNVEDFRHMLWDHLFFISDFKLDVDSPYPIPEKATYKGKPEPMAYPKRKPKYAHLGKNVELLINKALEEPEAEKKEAYVSTIAYYMKICYTNWHNEDVQDDSIRTELSILTKGQLEVSEDVAIRKVPVDSYSRSSGSASNNSGGAKKYYNNKNGGSSPSRSGSSNLKSNSGPSSRNGNTRSGFDGRPDNRRDDRNKNNNNRSNNNYKKRF